MSDQLRDAVRSALAKIIADSPEPPSYGRIALATRPAARSKLLQRFHPLLTAAASAVLVLVVVGGLTLLLRQPNQPTADATTIPLVTTTTTTPTTTTTATTTTTEPAVSLPAITWTRVDVPVYAASGPADQGIKSVSVVGTAIYLTGYRDTGEVQSGVIWRSEDGYTWERFDDPSIFGGDWFQNVLDVASKDGVTVAVGLECNEQAMQPSISGAGSVCAAVVWNSLDDGHTWTRLPQQDVFFGTEGSSAMYAVTATADGFLAAGESIWVSPDGFEWTLVDSPRSSIWDIAATSSINVAVGQNWDNGSEAAAWWSTDGINWTRVSDVDGNFDAGMGKVSWLTRVEATNNGFVAVGTAGLGSEAPIADFEAAVWLSPTGRTWRRVSQDQLNGYHLEVMRGVAVIGDLLVGVGESENDAAYALEPVSEARGVGAVWISQDDGETWTRMEDPDHVFGAFVSDHIGLNDIAVLGDRLIAVGYDGAKPAVWIGTIEKGETQ